MDHTHRRRYTLSPSQCEESAALKPSLGVQVPEEGHTADPAAFWDRQSGAQELAFHTDLDKGAGSFVFCMIYKPLYRGQMETRKQKSVRKAGA